MKRATPTKPRYGARARARVAVLALMGAASVSAGVLRSRSTRTVPSVPREEPTSDYVSSSACKSCHPAAYATWHESYHRTMTQRAHPALVRAPDATLTLAGLPYTIRRKGGMVWATIPSLEPDERPLLLTTGSHHYQGYWFAGERQGELRMFPFVYLFADARWLPRHDAFLQPPDAEDSAVRWNSNCIQCHATAGQPAYDAHADAFDTNVGELGIACEACHGPGAAHVRQHQNPFERYAAETHSVADPTIVNPRRLVPDRASMVCGQCHAFTFPRDEDAFLRSGYARAYRPGDDLATARFLISPDAMHSPDAPHIDADVESMFWPDGTVRVGGREYNGLVASACFLRGEGERKLGCASCHAMHAGDPAGQVRPDRRGDEACFACHDDKRRGMTEHTHHRADSSGSRCVSCHMPKTSYALLKAVRSHRIDSPTLGSRAADRPPACTLCHLDRTRAWTEEALRRWWGRPAATLIEEDPEVGSGVRLLFAGNAAQRVIAAAAMGSKEAVEACGAAWMAPVLTRALEDPYAAVRIVAARSLRALPGFERLAVAPLASPGERTIDALIAERDDRAITISE